MEEAAMADEAHLGEPLEGGCQCGAVRYRVGAAARDIYHCHCSLCRKLHGTLFATWAVVPRGRLEITRGEGALATYESSPGVRRRFCRNCGCHLICEIDSDPELDWFTPGTLDGGVHPGHAPDREQHIFVGSKVEWRDIHGDLDQYETYPPAYGTGPVTG